MDRDYLESIGIEILEDPSQLQTYDEFMESLEDPTSYSDPSLYEPPSGLAAESSGQDSGQVKTTPNSADIITMHDGTGLLYLGDGSRQVTFYNSSSVNGLTSITTGAGDNTFVFGSEAIDTEYAGTGRSKVITITAGDGWNTLDLTNLGNGFSKGALVEYLKTNLTRTTEPTTDQAVIYQLNLGSQKISLAGVDNILVNASTDKHDLLQLGLRVALDTGTDSQPEMLKALSLSKALYGREQNLLRFDSIPASAFTNTGEVSRLIDFSTIFDSMLEDDVNVNQIINYYTTQDGGESLLVSNALTVYPNSQDPVISYLWRNITGSEFQFDWPIYEELKDLTDARLLELATDYVESGGLDQFLENGMFIYAHSESVLGRSWSDSYLTFDSFIV